jgi:hypothetical protein
VAAVDWTSWLADFNRELLERLDLETYSAFRDPRVTPDLVRSGWLGSAPADESTLVATEARLGTRLPPSYRSFLAASNGFVQPDLIVPRLRASSEIGWYGELAPESVEIWSQFADADEQTGRLGTCLQVSDVELVGDAVYLLDPTRSSSDGEWDAYFFASWVPGVDRYPSFLALMEAKRDELVNPPPAEALARPAPSVWRVLWDVVRGRGL